MTALKMSLLLGQVVQVPPGYIYAHHQLIEEFRNKTVWPKHLLVQYSWTATQTVDALSGLYVVFLLCEYPLLSLHPLDQDWILPLGVCSSPLSVF